MVMLGFGANVSVTPVVILTVNSAISQLFALVVLVVCDVFVELNL